LTWKLLPLVNGDDGEILCFAGVAVVMKIAGMGNISEPNQSTHPDS
jgi:hypothetical protein